jgi:sn-glycerol 3-phosphate transport system substrate-binding protein
MDNATIQGSAGTSWFETNPNFRVAADQLAGSQSTVATAGALMGEFPAIRNIVTAAIDQALLTDGADIQAILDQAAADANTTLGEYNALNS